MRSELRVSIFAAQFQIEAPRDAEWSARQHLGHQLRVSGEPREISTALTSVLEELAAQSQEPLLVKVQIHQRAPSRPA